MTKTELTGRLATMTPALILQIETMIRDGYGAQGITQNSSATLKQANAVFQARKAPEWAAALSAARAANISQHKGGRTFALDNFVGPVTGARCS
jgi:hypothetical protein